MTTAKIAVSVPSDVLARAKRAVRRGRARSLSAYVTRALDESTKLDDLSELLDEMLAESGGPLSAKEEAAADKALRGPSNRRAR